MLLLLVQGAVIGKLLSPTPFYERQMNEYTCGDATLSMLLSMTGPGVSQHDAIGVMRTTNATGTLLADMVRGAERSSRSGWPEGVVVPDGYKGGYGWTGRGFGLVAFAGAATRCWVDGLEALVALNLPVAVLQWWSGARDADDGGHYRLVVGTRAGTVTVMDPWDRDGFPRVPELPVPRFCDLWNYTDKDAAGDLRGAFSGMYASPLVVEVSVAIDRAGGFGTVTASVDVPCIAPICTSTSGKVVTGVRAVLSLPYGLSLVSGVGVELASDRDLAIPGQPLRFVWKFEPTDQRSTNIPVALEPGASVEVVAVGRVAGAVPDRQGWFPNIMNYTGYNFSDLVSGKGRWVEVGAAPNINSRNKTTIVILAVSLAVSLVFSALLALSRKPSGPKGGEGKGLLVPLQ